MNRLFAKLRRRLRHGEEGLSLIEMMVAVLLLGVAVLALASTSITSLINLRQARDREAATNAASARIEEVRALDFEDIVLSPTDPDATALGGCFDGEPVVTNTRPTTVDAATTVDLGTGHPEVDVRTYITWFQTAGDADCAGANDAERVAKRLTVEAIWVDGETRTVRQDTIVAKAERGLPVPDFDVSPPGGAVNFTPDHVAATTEKCVRHQLRNLGAEDAYDWSLDTVTGSIAPPSPAGPSSFTARNPAWSARAYFEYPALASSDEPPAGAEVMTDFDANGRPETTQRVAEGDTANIWLCWQPPTGEPEGTIFSATMSVHSLFDGNRSEAVSHTVSVNRQGELYYLYDPNDSAAHDRGTPQGSGVVILPYVMGPLQPDNPSSVANLGIINYGDPQLSDWDRNLDPLDQAGVWLPGGAANSDLDLVWHRQFPESTVLASTATLELWVATSAALDGAPSNSAQQLNITIQRIKENESALDNPGGTLLQHTEPWTDDVEGWKKLTIPLNFGGNVTIGENKYLRLQISCAGSVSDCNVAYDNVAHPSVLIVERL